MKGRKFTYVVSTDTVVQPTEPELQPDTVMPTQNAYISVFPNAGPLSQNEDAGVGSYSHGNVRPSIQNDFKDNMPSTQTKYSREGDVTQPTYEPIPTQCTYVNILGDRTTRPSTQTEGSVVFGKGNLPKIRQSIPSTGVVGEKPANVRYSTLHKHAGVGCDHPPPPKIETSTQRQYTDGVGSDGIFDAAAAALSNKNEKAVDAARTSTEGGKDDTEPCELSLQKISCVGLRNDRPGSADDGTAHAHIIHRPVHHTHPEVVAEQVTSDIRPLTRGQDDNVHSGVPATETSQFKKILPQFLATAAKNLLLVNFGAVIGFTAIILPILSGPEYFNARHTLYLTQRQATWLGTLVFIIHPIGCLLSVWINFRLGRKFCLMLSTIPSIIAWFMLYPCDYVGTLFAALGLLGLSCGLIQTSAVIYTGETSDPIYRGVLLASTSLAVLLGYFLVFILATVLDWHFIALVIAFIPILAAICIFFIPETPVWLLSKKKHNEAYEAVQWLNGWVKTKSVNEEFKTEEQYANLAIKCLDCHRAQLNCYHVLDSVCNRITELRSRSTRLPIVVLLVYSLLIAFSGYPAIRPHLTSLLQTYSSPINIGWALVLVGLTSLLSNILGIIMIYFIGKRIMALISFTLSTTAFLGLCIYTKLHVSDYWTSYDQFNYSMMGIYPPHYTQNQYIPLLLIFLSALSYNFGLFPVQWMLMGEIFPFRTREWSVAIAAIVSHLLIYFASLTYLHLEWVFRLWGVSFFYSIICIIGFVFVFFFLPETEKICQEDIERHYANKRTKWTTTKIVPNSFQNSDPSNQNDEENNRRLSTFSNKRGIVNTAYD